MIAMLSTLAGSLLAQGTQPVEPSRTDPRFFLYLGLTLVFVCLIGYLVVTHGRTRKIVEDCTRLEGRIAELEGSPTGTRGRS